MARLRPAAHATAVRAAAAGTTMAAALALTFTLALAATAAPAAAATTTGVAARPAPTALVVFYDAEGDRPPAVPGVSLGLVSAAEQAGYARAQFLLDLTQGARVGGPAYPAGSTPQLRLAGSQIAGWAAARHRAAGAAGRLQPGLLAGSIPGGAAYAGAGGPRDGEPDAVVAAGRDGQIAHVSLGGADDLLARIAELRRTSALVVADLPAGAAGRADLAQLARTREAGELLVSMQRVERGGELLWAGVAGLRQPATAREPAPGELESASTEQRGLVSAVDVAPTILDHLRVPVPAAMQGRSISSGGRLDAGSLRTLAARLRAIPGRRLPALGLLLAACALLVLACAPRPRARAFAMRTSALALLWAPCAALVPAATAPGPAAEYALIAGVALALAAATDRILAWPRALAAPALATPLAIAVDTLARTRLQIRSLAGPDPIGGARFFGIGNELKSALAATALVGLAAALYPLGRTGRRRAGLATVAAGLLLLVIEGWARIGAGVGGAALVAAAFGLAAAMVLVPDAGVAGGGRRGSRTPWLVALASAPAGLALLIAVDLATARGHGHLRGSVLDARSLADVRDEIANRYATAWRALRGGGMAVATATAVALAAAGVRLREPLLRPVGGDPLFAAAFAGGLLGGVVGALVEDSGPLLLVEAVAALAAAALYLHAAGPQPAPARAGADYASSSATPSAAAERPTIAVLGGNQGSA